MVALNPFILKIEFVLGTTASNSFPSAMPEREIPSEKVVPLTEILVGMVEDKVAVPPEIERLKSVASNNPLEESVL